MKRNQSMKKSMRALLGFFAIGVLFASGNASAWIRFALLEHPPGSNQPMQVEQQVWRGAGPWRAGDPRIPQYFSGYVDAPEISNLTPSSVSFAFNLFKDPDDASKGAASADVGNYNFFEQGTNILTATLEISQSQERVTIEYLSALGGAALVRLPGGTSIDGIEKSYNVNDRFDSIPVCGSELGECAQSRIGPIYPPGLYIQVARIPEPAVIPLLGSALFAAMAVGRFSRRRSGTSPLPRK